MNVKQRWTAPGEEPTAQTDLTEGADLLKTIAGRLEDWDPRVLGFNQESIPASSCLTSSSGRR